MGGKRSIAAASLVALVAGFSRDAAASGAWVPSGNLEPIEQRVAVAVGPDRTTVWTSLRFQADAGEVGLVIPAPPGSSLDISSDAWFEALEVATAPRVFPPAGLVPYCPGKKGPASIFEIAGQVDHVASLPIDDVAVLDDAAAVSTWAAQGGLVLAPELAAALAAIPGARFVALRVHAPGGAALSPTLRIAMPGAPPVLPLALTRAGSADLRVTTWLLGGGRAGIVGSSAASVSPSDLRWKADAKASDYDAQRAAALDAEGPSGALLECTGHEPLVTNVSIAGGTASIDGLVTAFFDRASAYGDALVDPSKCVAQASAALASNALVSASCPRADLGVLDGGGPACVESPLAGWVDPATLRCGGSADDLAVALSGLPASGAWLTRQTMQIPAGKLGGDWALQFAAGAAVSPVITAKILDLGGCNGGGGGSSMSGTSGVTSGATTGTGLLFGDTGGGGPSYSSGGPSYSSGGSGHDDPGGGVDISIGDGWSDGTVVDTGCGCSGTSDTADTSSDGCSGTSDTSGGDSCSGDTGSSGDSCSGGSEDASGCDGSSAGGEDCSSSGGGDVDCSGGGGDVDCSGGGGDVDCSIKGRAGAHRPRAPRFSVMALTALALVAPLRRRGRKAGKQTTAK